MSNIEITTLITKSNPPEVELSKKNVFDKEVEPKVKSKWRDFFSKWRDVLLFTCAMVIVSAVIVTLILIAFLHIGLAFNVNNMMMVLLSSNVVFVILMYLTCRALDAIVDISSLVLHAISG